MPRSANRLRRGFSFLELLAALVASTVVMAGFLGLYVAAVQLEKQSLAENEDRYLSIFAQDRLLAKLRDATAVVRVRDMSGTPTSVAALAYERIALSYDVAADGYRQDLASERSFTGVVFLAGDRLLLRERRPIGAGRLLQPADLSTEAAANEGAGSRAAVTAFVSASLASLPGTREEVVGQGLAEFELGPAAVKIAKDPTLGTPLFSADFGLSCAQPPVTP